MKTIVVNGTTVVVAHIVSFALSDEEIKRGTRELVLRIRLSNGDEVIAHDEELSRVHVVLRRAFGIRRRL